MVVFGVIVKTRSAKNKGRTLQNYVRDRVREEFSLGEGDVDSRTMGCSGVDVVLSPRAREFFPFSVECKAQESLNVWESLRQAEDNMLPSTIPLLVFKRNRSTVYCALDFNTFLVLWKSYKDLSMVNTVGETRKIVGDEVWKEGYESSATTLRPQQLPRKKCGCTTKNKCNASDNN
jgi:hypothetical protein